MNKIDLHTHSTASDGKNSPAEIISLSQQEGLMAVAITDHDTVSGIEEAATAGQKLGIEVVPGIEISTLQHGQDIHVLGYYIDYMNPDLLEELAELRKTRQLRNQMMVAKLNELGIAITMSEVEAKQTKEAGNIGRPHIAEVLIDKGVVHSLAEAFEQYLGREGKAYVNPPRISPAEGVQLVLRYGGVPILAHPGLYDQDQLIAELMEVGLKGIEVYHPDHSEADIAKYEQIAQSLGLLMSGGSDYHGARNGQVFHGALGSQCITYEALELIKEKRS